MNMQKLISSWPVAGVLVAGSLVVGAAAWHARSPAEATAPREATPTGSRANDEMVARLKDYASTAGTEETAPAGGKLLPDVNTMIDRLAARLETAPEDIRGWRMLGWSYANTGRYKDAAAAFARAVQLDPNSADLKASYEEAKARATAGGDSQAAPGAHGKVAEGAAVARHSGIEAMPAQERDAAIRSMVDGLADRLANAPRDEAGWTRLMRSRVVLGEKEVAATALRKALDVFKDDADASGRIAAAAVELGLKAE